MLGAMAGLGFVALDRGTEPGDPPVADVGGEASSEKPPLMQAEAPSPPPPPPEPNETAPPAPKPIPARPLSKLAKQMRATPAMFKELVDAARLYFDLDEPVWRGREALLTELETHAAAGRYVLKDMDALRWLVYQGRSFERQLTNRKWQKAFGVSENKRLGGTLYWLKSEDLTLNFSIPTSYPKKAKDLRREIPRGDPFPLLISLHEKHDFNAKYPGQALLKRRYPVKEWPELYAKWIVMCPIAAAGNFVDKKGGIRDKVFRNVFAEFWRHYNLDFERIVLDGSEQAFVAATSMPIFFAGFVFHGAWKLETDEQKALVKNFAHVPTYVVGNPDLVEQLRNAGHEAVTGGARGPDLMAWLASRERVLPKKFTWTIPPKRYDQVLAYWVNLGGTNWDVPKREISVDVVDTEKEPNTIKIKTIGIDSLSLFLNDDIVDLDRNVRVEINGHVEHDERIAASDRFKKVGRDFDFLFNREPVRIRVSMFFGWLTPARIVSLAVRPPRHAPEPPPPPPPPPEPTLEAKLVPQEIVIPPAEVVADPPRDPPEQDAPFPLLTLFLALTAFAALVLLLQQRRRG